MHVQLEPWGVSAKAAFEQDLMNVSAVGQQEL